MIIAVSAINSFAQYVDFSSWEHHDTIDEIKIYTKDSTGSLKKFGAEFEIKGGISDALKLLKEVNAYEDWIEGIQNAEALGEMTSTSYRYHFFINKKILFGLYEIKKDGIVKSIVTNYENFVKIESNIDRSAPQLNEYDRIEHYQVKWTLIPFKNGKIKVSYEGVVDVQINFAYQLIKPTILENLQGTFQNMKRKLASQNTKS